MARVGGRSTWFSWFVGAVCVGIVGVLVWLAVPALPGVSTWLGGVLRSATEPQVEPDEPEVIVIRDAETDAERTVPATCRALYPESLWGLLESTADATLIEGDDALADQSTGLAETLEAEPLLACEWTVEDGPSVGTRVWQVSATAAEVAEPVLRDAGYVCSVTGLKIVCERTRDGVTAQHEIRDGLWVVDIYRGWNPPGYYEGVARSVWR